MQNSLIHCSLAGVGFYYDAEKDIIFNDRGGKHEVKKYNFTENELAEIIAAAARHKLQNNGKKDN